MLTSQACQGPGAVKLSVKVLDELNLSAAGATDAPVAFELA